MAEWWMFGGPNGCGKSTVYGKLSSSPQYRGMMPFQNYLNADDIARRLCPSNPRSADYPAGKELLLRRGELLRSGQSFVQETTLSGRNDLKQIVSARQNGWYCGLILIWLNSVQLSRQRVALRVARGGHHISDADIERRWLRIRDSAPRYVDVMDRVLLFNNSGSLPMLIASCQRNQSGKLDIAVHVDGDDALGLLP